MKPIALIFVLLALFAVSDRALTSAEATSTHSVVATASVSTQGGALAPLSITNPCPPICCDQACDCVRTGGGTAGHCIYHPNCVCN